MRSRRTIVAKLRPPPLAPVLIPRPRVEEAFARAAGGHRVLLVIAGAGAGKTTAAARFLEARGGRTAWLSLDPSDTADGRFVSYLAAAVGRAEPRLEALVQDSLADGLLADDCAGLLAERLGSGWTIVLDDLHHLEPDAPALGPLEDLLRYLPADALAVLVSRRMPSVDVLHGLLTDQLSGVFDAELAFSVHGSRRCSRPGTSQRQPARRPGRHGRVGRRDRLRGPAAPWEPVRVPDRRGPAVLLSRGGDPPRAHAPAAPGAAADGGARHRHRGAPGAPAGRSSHRSSLRSSPACTCPPRPGRRGCATTPSSGSVLEYRLRRELPGEVGTLLESYGRILAEDGFSEEAVYVLLESGRHAEAEELAQASVKALRRRGDWSKILGWTDALGEEVLRRRPALREAQVRALLNTRRQEALEDLVHHMLATGEVGELVESAPDVAAWAVWALHGSGEWAKLVPLRPRAAGPGGRGDALHARLLRRPRAARGPERVGAGADAPAARGAAGGALLQGRLLAASQLADVAAAAGGPVTAAVAQVHKVNVLRARGDTAAARRVLETVPTAIRSSRFIEFWLHAEAELCLEEGNGERALSSSARRARCRRGTAGGWATGPSSAPSRAGCWCVWEPPRRRWRCSRTCARGAPSAGSPRSASGPRRGWEAPCWSCGGRPGRPGAAGPGGCRHAAGAPPPGAARRRRVPGRGRVAGSGSRTSRTTPPMPPTPRPRTAAPCIRSRAPWSSCRTSWPAGSTPQAVDSERRWRTLVVRSPSGVAALATEHARLRVRTLGPPALEIDGEPVANVPLKAVELAAEIARAGPPGIARSQLVSSLQGSRDGPNYLRQLVFRLRRALPSELELRSSGTKLAWRPAEAVASDDALLESLHGRLRVEVGQGLTEALERALELVDRGQYMEGLDDDSILFRRRWLAGLATDVRLDYARAMRVAGDPGRALAVLTAAIDADPYSEDAWQELMRVQAGLAGPAAVGRVFIECRRSFSEVGLEPLGETRVMLERLRG